MIRPGRDADALGFARLVEDAWAEYPGCVFDLDGELPELRALATHFSRQGGALWAAQSEGEEAALLGMVATRPLREDSAWEICRLYVDRAARGTGLAHRLLDAAEAHAAAGGARRMVLWTDTRFEAAHRFYEKRGYVRQGAIRILDDLSRSLEFRYAKPATGLVVEALDAAAAASAERGLAALLVACVAGGASLSWRAPLAPEAARAHWREASQQVAASRRALLLAWLEGRVAGSVSLNLDTEENQPRRAFVEKLMVDPSLRRQGVGRALMQRAEQAAARLGRPLLSLETRAGLPGEALFRALGWREAGRIPGAELDEAGAAHDVITFWRSTEA